MNATIPTVRVVGPKGLAIINASDLELYQSKGFKLEAEVDMETENKSAKMDKSQTQPEPEQKDETLETNKEAQNQ